MQATPLRHHVADSVPADGVWPLGTTEVTYVEQAEVTVLDILRAATDLSADSPELDAAGEGAAVTYHLNSRRANVVRFLDLPADAAVLEVGAGCGAVTRYLGETCAVVDALEPMPRRAAVARERCRDLTTVEVFAGELGDVPAVPAYDVVLVNGVLEYVGNGSADPAPYVAFLGECAARLLPGGVLIVAIENQLGVKYVVGSPEDHTDHEFDSLEGYPRPNHARVFSRRGLTGLLAAAGLEVAEVLGAFPDYKRTAVLMAPSIDTVDSSLPYRIPPFPSPDRRGFRHRVADEAAVWRTIVEAGLTWEFPNSFVVLAHTPGEPRTVWPRGRHAVFARNIRRPEFSQRTVVEDVAGVPTFRRILNPAAGTPVDGVRLVGNDAPYQPGVELMDVLRTADDEALATWLARWAELVRQWPWDDGAPLDLLPHNALLSSDDEIVLVDVSGKGQDAGVRSLLLSGAFGGLLGTMPPERFLPAANSYLLSQDWPEGFATAVHLTVRLDTGAFTVTTAGHPPAVHLHAGSGLIEPLDTSGGPALGIVEAPCFPVHRGVVEHGDTIMLYTDGLVESPGSDVELGIDRLMGEAERFVATRSGGAAAVLDGVRAGDNDDRALILVHRD